MPPVVPPQSRYLVQTLGQMNSRLAALERQQQQTLTNGSGQPVINFGLAPGSNPAMFGFQAVNPATGSPTMFIGSNGSGEAVIEFYDATGDVLLTISPTGLAMFNAAGQQEVAVGLLATGDYGLEVTDPSTGASQEILPAVTSLGSSGGYTVGSSLVPVGNPVNATIRTSGDAVVSMTAYMGLINAGSTSTTNGSLTLYVGPAAGPFDIAPGVAELTLTSPTGVELASTLSATSIVTGLTPGALQFQLYGQATGGAPTMNVGVVFLSIQPI